MRSCCVMRAGLTSGNGQRLQGPGVPIRPNQEDNMQFVRTRELDPDRKRVTITPRIVAALPAKARMRY